MMNAYTDFKAPAKLRPLRDIVDEYDTKLAATSTAIDEFKQSITAIEMSANIGGAYGGSVWGRGISPSIYERDVQKVLLKSAWKHVYDGLNIAKIAPAGDRKAFDMAFENPAPFTLDNIRATFGKYLTDTRFHILRGLAECFVQLDPAYKSHSKMKIGVAGLPKRIILSGVMGSFSYGSWGQEKLKDTINAILTYRGEPHIEYAAFENMLNEARRHGEADWPGGRLQGYLNGNAHVIFDKETLLEVNRALAEFYGDILPDVEPDDDEADLFRQPSREVSKDLQYYWTSQSVIDKIVGHLDYSGDKSVPLKLLEPSCGDGRIMDGIQAWSQNPEEFRYRPKFEMTGIEYHAGRAAAARAKGHSVISANFLDTPPVAKFDWIVMNPPFYGKHWRKHLDHALKFRKPRAEGDRWGGGHVICILPATAYYDGHLDDLITRKGRDDGWTDLPVASFSESGTNVPTGYFVI